MRKTLATILTAFLTVSLLSGCGAETENTVSVQSVGMLCGLTDTLQQQVFAGIVSTGNEANIKKDSNKKVAKVNVKKGDTVKAGDVLFTYDAEQAQNALEKARLELEEQRNGLESKEEEKYQLEVDKQRAKADDQLAYTLKIQEMDTDIRETQYNIALKEKEILSLEDATKDLDVYAPFDGIIEKAGQADSGNIDMSFGGEEEDMDEDLYNDFDVDEEGSSEGFIKLVEADNYRIKGTINETNIDVITVGMEMVIHSRVDDTVTWKGVVDSIDYKSPTSGQNSGGGFSDDTDDAEMTTTSKYPFYVKIDGLEGLIIGQHVYMTEDLGLEEEAEEIRLSSSFINDAEEDPWVWAEKNGVLEKRSVTLGEYAEEEDCWVILNGLTADDYIAVPSSTYKEGQPVIENDLAPFEEDEVAPIGDEEGLTDSFGDEEFFEGDFVDDEDLDIDFDDEDIVDLDMDLEDLYTAAGEEIVG